MKKRIIVTLVALITLLALLLSACADGNTEQAESPQNDVSAEVEDVQEEDAQEDDAQEEQTVSSDSLMMATTTSTADTGILEVLSERFLEDTGISLAYTSVGTGEALSLGRNGDVDIVFVHARASEEEFVADGYGVERIPVMFNDFVVIGPLGDIEKNDDVFETFRLIYENQLPFVSRGDNSGTHQMEVAIWEELELDPTENPNYMESGQGMGATISMADEMNAFALTDRGTWLRQSQAGDIDFDIEIICEGDEALFNQYGIIAINPDKYPDTNIDAANAFIDWIVSEEIQELIRYFGVEEFGEPLFVPNAGTDS